MKSKTLFFSKGIWMNNIKGVGWISVSYLLCLLFMVPLKIYMIFNQEVKTYDSMKYIFNLSQDFQRILMLTVPVLMGIFIFRYMQVKKSSDFVHSLPIKREKIYNNHICTGLIFMVLPLLFTALMAIILHGALKLQMYYSLEEVWRWFGITSLMNIVIFFSTAFVGMLTGISIIQGILTYVLLVLPVAIIYLINSNLGVLIYGYQANYKDVQYTIISPIVRILESNNLYKLNWKEALVYIFISFIFYGLALVLYKIRDVESVSQPIVFSKLKVILKYGATFCLMLAGGSYFWESQWKIGWLFFGYGITSFMGYIVIEMILQKSLWGIKNLKGYGIYISVIIVLLLGIKMDFTRYESKIPELEKIESVYFSDGFYYEGLEETNEKPYFKEKENIKNIYALHEQIIRDKEKLKYLGMNYNGEMKFIVLEYHIENGKSLKRAYRIPTADYKEYLKPIEESIEDKKIRYNILKANFSEFDKIEINRNLFHDSISIVDPKEIKEAMEILQQEIMDATYEELNDSSEPWANVTLVNKKKPIEKIDEYSNGYHYVDYNINLSWIHSFESFEKWLEEKGYLEKARVMPKDIDYIVIEEVKDEKEIETTLRKRGRIEDLEAIEKVKRLEVRDKEKIEICLRNYKSIWGSKSKYIIGFYSSKDNEKVTQYATFDKVPSFVKEYFEN